jgi:PhnB protein
MSEEKIAGVAYALQPMLSVGNGARAVEFYKRAFGAAEVFRIEDPSGAVVARLSVKSAEFWLSDESPEHANFSPETLGGSTTRMVLIVPDPRDHVAWVAAVLARMESVKPGMTRAVLLKTFNRDGGLQGFLWGRFVSRECPYFKVDVKFRAVRRPERDSSGRETSVESAEDVIVTISRPYVERPAID